MVKAGALERVNESVTTPYHREHLTSFIYLQENGDFSLRWLEIEALAPFVESVRLTIDSKDDFNNGREVYRAIGEVGWRSIVSYIDKHPGIREKMEQQILLYRK